MSIRRLVIAALLAGAGAAHADTIPTQPAPSSNAVSGWTAGNGTDVLGSGVLKDNVNLVGGVAHGANSDANLNALLGKVNGTINQVDGQTKLYFQSGIEASYLLAAGNGILAASLGPGKSVVSTADGHIIADGVNKAPGMTGGGNATNTGGGTGSGSTGGTSGSGSTGSGSTGGTGGSGSTGSTGGTGSTGSTGSGGGTGSTGGTGGGTSGGGTSGGGSDLGQVGTLPQLQQDAVAVPEPSSIALMLLGMVGAGAITRRRAR